VMGAMDRNGLRPMRYAVTADGLIVAGSEAGMVRLNEQEIVENQLTHLLAPFIVRAASATAARMRV